MTPIASPRPAEAAVLNDGLRRTSAGLLILLILVCLAWELALAPVHPGGSWLVLKVVPLLLPLRGVLRGSLYTFQWASMLSLLYVMEGAVRVVSDPGQISRTLAGIELALAGAFFAAAVIYVRPAKRAAKAAARQAGPRG